MKRFTFLAASFLAAVLTFSSCTEEVQTPDPVFAPVSQDDIAVPAEGGEFGFEYVIENPAEDGHVSATAEGHDWITGIDCSESNHVTFEVSENLSEEGREGEIEVVYEYSGETQSFSVKVVQSGAVPVAEPSLTLTGEGEMEIPVQGGIYEIGFKLENPVEGGEISAIGDTWITPVLNESSVTFAIPANEGERREGTLTIKYKWNDGADEVVAAVTIRQASLADQYPDAFVIEVDPEGVTFSMAWVYSECAYPDLTWRSYIISKDDYDSSIGGDKGLMREYFIDLIYEMSVEWGYEDVLGFLGTFLFTGDFKDNRQYIELSSGTTYMTYAVGMDYEMNYLTEFFYGPEFTTKDEADFSVRLEVEPDVNTALVNSYPSDQATYYYVSAIEKEEFDVYYTDESLMEEICDVFGTELLQSAFIGDRPNYTIRNLRPDTEYYAYAFGVDPYTYRYCSVLSKEQFRTLQETGPAELKASASITNYWDINDLIAYNPEYENLPYYGPVLAAVDFTYEGSTPKCIYYVFPMDMTNMVSYARNSTLMMGTVISKGDPAPIIEQDYDGNNTLCVIGMDEDGNVGDDTFVMLISLSEDGKSDDYGLFDDLYNN